MMLAMASQGCSMDEAAATLRKAFNFVKAF